MTHTTESLVARLRATLSWLPGTQIVIDTMQEAAAALEERDRLIAEMEDDYLAKCNELELVHAFTDTLRAELDALRSQASEPALSTEDQCFCDANNLGVRGVSCGDCPRDYKQEPAPSTAGELPPFNDPRVQIAYKILVDDERPPKGEHWEGFLARKIVAALLEAHPKLEPLTDVMTWNEMYQRLDFLNGRPIAAYSAPELMQIEIRELRKALEAAHKIGDQG